MCNIRERLDDILGWAGLTRRELDRLRSSRKRTIRIWKESTRNWWGTSDILSAPSAWIPDWSWCGNASCRSFSRIWRSSSKDSLPIFIVEATQIHIRESLQRHAGSHWGQDRRCSARFGSHLQDGLNRPQSKLQRLRCCTAHNIKEKTFRVIEHNGVRTWLTMFGPPTLEKPVLKLDTGQQVIQHDCWCIHFSNVFFFWTSLCCRCPSHSVQTHRADVFLNFDAQIQELSYQESVMTYPCHRNGDSGRKKIPKWENPGGGNHDDLFLWDGQSDDQHLIQDGTTFERWISIRQMYWHCKIFKDVLLVKGAQDEKADPPCSFKMMKRVGSEFSWLFFFLRRHVSLLSAFDDSFFGGYSEVSLPTALKSDPELKSVAENSCKDSWWRTSSPSAPNADIFSTHPVWVWLFASISWRTCVCRNAHEIQTCGPVGCSETTITRWPPSGIRDSMWTLTLSFCSADLTHSALEFVKSHRICTPCSIQHVACGGGTSCVQRHRDGRVFVSVANVWRAHPHTRIQCCTRCPGRFLTMFPRRECLETGIRILLRDRVINTVSWCRCQGFWRHSRRWS